MPTTTQLELRLASRMSRLGTETAFEVLNRARALEKKGKEIIHLEIGEPDFDTPANIIEAGVDALYMGWTHYGPAAGLPDLRQAIADYVSRTRKVPVSSEEVVVVPGGKPIIFFTILALIEAGDEVIYPNPGFPIYESMINYLDGRAVPIRLREERDFSLDVKELASLISDRTKLIILNSPHNPTGGTLTKKDILDIAEAIGDRNILILSDEIYSRLIYEGEHFSIMSVPGFKERTILLDGFSKTYAMTGWRMGYGVMRPDLAVHIARLMTNSTSCTASFTQVAGIAALRGDQSSVDKMSAEFKRRRDAFVAGLNKIKGFSCRTAERCVLRLPQHYEDRLAFKETGRRTARTSRSRLPLRHRLRRIRRRLSPLQRSQLAREPEHGAALDRRLGREEPALKGVESRASLPGWTGETRVAPSYDKLQKLCELSALCGSIAFISR